MLEKDKEKQKDKRNGLTIFRNKVYGFAITGYREFKQRVVICDKVVAFRSTRSITQRIIQVLSKEVLGKVTVTLTQNKITNQIGYTLVCQLTSKLYDLYFQPNTIQVVDLVKEFKPIYTTYKFILLTR